MNKQAMKLSMLTVSMCLALSAAAQQGVKTVDAPYVPASNAKAVVDVVPIESAWTVKPGSLLRESLQEWTTKAGWSLVWGLSEQDDFRLNSGNSYDGDFKTAVVGLINSLPATVRIRVELRTDNVPPLLYVTTEEGIR